MKISNLYNKNKKVISLEIFPPKSTVSIESIYDKLQSFSELTPDFISVTYGAGGSEKDRTIEIASKIEETYKTNSMAHITCVGNSKEQINRLLQELKDNKVENILALRGDAPSNIPDFDMSQNSFQYAADLIAYIRQTFKDDFCISAACYPEGHAYGGRIKDDINFLKQKVDEGVDFLVTQLFFDNRIFYDFWDRIQEKGVLCPLAAGVMPIFKAEQIKRIASLCGASIPAKLVILMDKYGDNPEDMRKAGVEYACNQIRDLLENDVDGIHLMTMNRPKSTKEIISCVR